MTTRTVSATVLVGDTRHVVEASIDVVAADHGYGESAYGVDPYGEPDVTPGA